LFDNSQIKQCLLLECIHLKLSCGVLAAPVGRLVPMKLRSTIKIRELGPLFLILVLVAALGHGVGGSAIAQRTASITIIVKGGQFQPNEIRAKAGSPLTLRVLNLDSNPVEFSCRALRAGALVSPNTSEIVQVVAKLPGRYTFVDARTANQGVLILD
jgi:cupredoxin-like protein